MHQQGFREKILSSLGASSGEVKEPLAYDENRFDHSGLNPSIKISLPDELFITTWEGYEREAGKNGVLAALREFLVQLRFPIRKGISKTEYYRAANPKASPPRKSQRRPV